MRKVVLLSIGSFISVITVSQPSYLIKGSPYDHLIDRLEIKGRANGLNHSFSKPINERFLFEDIRRIDSAAGTYKLTPIDRHHLQRFLSNRDTRIVVPSKHPLQETGNLIVAGNDKAYIIANPLLSIQQSFDVSEKNAHLYSSGATARGALGKLGYHFYLTANHEELPCYMHSWMNRYQTVPGYDEPTVNHTASRYWDLRWSIQTSIGKLIDLQLGNDRLFIGNGHRSLFLSDIAGNMLFFKFNTRVWIMNFQSIYAKLNTQRGVVDRGDIKKFYRMNAVDFNVSKWLNVGVFEALISGRENHFDLNYIMPFTFLRAMERHSGSPDNAMIGLNVKANLKKQWQFYFQALADEFKVSEVTGGKGWWANKFGYQAGAKYIDAFGIKNLDLQGEFNKARPFTYSHFDSVANYSHNNQPMAHPLGANFQELIGIVRYQPSKRLYLEGKLVYYTQGLDSAGANMGNNVLTPYLTRPYEYGWKIGNGDKVNCVFVSASASYAIRENLFIDMTVTGRKFSTELSGTDNTVMIQMGIRWNVAKRVFDY